MKFSKVLLSSASAAIFAFVPAYAQTTDAEMQIIRHALGDVPLVGFFAAGEIARDQLYGYTGVLTVFTTN